MTVLDPLAPTGGGAASTPLSVAGVGVDVLVVFGIVLLTLAVVADDVRSG